MENNTKLHIVTFAHPMTKEYNFAQQNNKQSCLKFGADSVYDLNLHTLKSPDYVKDFIATITRAGYGIFKPWAILQVMDEVEENDIILFLDCTIFCSKDLKHVKTFIQKNNFLTVHAGKGSKFTKRNIVRHLGYDENNWENTIGHFPQIISGIIGVTNNKECRTFIEEWKDIMHPSNKVLWDNSRDKNEFKGYMDSRHEQMTLSVLYYLRKPHVKLSSTRCKDQLKLFGLHVQEGAVYHNTHKTRPKLPE